MTRRIFTDPGNRKNYIEMLYVNAGNKQNRKLRDKCERNWFACYSQHPVHRNALKFLKYVPDLGRLPPSRLALAG